MRLSVSKPTVGNLSPLPPHGTIFVGSLLLGTTSLIIIISPLKIKTKLIVSMSVSFLQYCQGEGLRGQLHITV